METAIQRSYRKGSRDHGPDQQNTNITELTKKRSDRRYPYTGQAIYLSRQFSGITVLVGATATFLFTATYEWPYIVANPNRSFAGNPLILYIGGAGVSVASGFPLAEGTYQYFVVEEGTSVYAVAAANLNIIVMQT